MDRDDRGAPAAAAVDGFTAEVVTGLGLAGVRSILLKGPVLARWLYGRAPRHYTDADLLVSPGDQVEAIRVLERLGFERVPEERVPPQEGPPHAWPWARARDGAEVDLHHTFFGVGVGPEALWKEVAGRTERLDVGGTEVEVLAAPARALVVAVHAAQHGAPGEKQLEDLARALDRTEEPAWAEAAALAARLDASHTFATGLRLLRPGARLAERLGLVDAALVESSRRAPLVIGLDRLARTRGAGAKLALAGRELAPSRAYMRWRFPVARRGLPGLVAAYLWRPLWLLRHAPQSARAWRAGRRRETGAAAQIPRPRGPADRVPAARRYRVFGLALASFPLEGLAEEPGEGTPDVALHLADRDELEEAWTGDPDEPAVWEMERDGVSLRVERGRGGDHRYSYGDRARFHLSADSGTLLCAPERPEDPAWRRVLLDTVLASACLAHGLEALHAGAVQLSRGAVAVMAPNASDRGALVAELVVRGAAPVSVDVLALGREAGEIVAHPGRGAKSAARPLAAMIVVERRAGAEAAIVRVRSSALDLLGYALGSVRIPDRMRQQFDLFADLADRVPLYRLTADGAVDTGRLADLVERALDAPEREAVTAG